MENNELTEKIKSLSELYLQELLAYKQSSPEFTFWLRQRDYVNSPFKRLSNGYWFQGSDYIFISPYAKGDNNNKTRSIGFVTVFDNGLQTRNYLEVVWGADNNNDPKLVSFYNQLVRNLKMEPLTKTKYIRNYPDDDPVHNLREFLERDKPVIDALLRSYGLEQIFFIGETDFQKQLRKTLEVRKVLYNKSEDPLPKVGLNYTPTDLSHDTKSALKIGIFAKEIGNTIEALSENGTGTKNGNMFALFGRWGRGKTYMAQEIFTYLEKLRPGKYKRVNFPAWKYQDTHTSWAYLYEAFADAYFKEGLKDDLYGRMVKKIRKIRLNLTRKGILPLLGFLVFLTSFWLAISFGQKVEEGNPTTLQNILFIGFSSLTATSLVPFATFLFNIAKRSNTQLKNILNEYTSHTGFSSHLGLQAEIQKELKNLLKTWIRENRNQKIILFVDDLDRCNEEKIIQLVDALRVMLDEETIYKRVIILLAVDERILKMAIRNKYKNIIDNNILFMEDTEIEYLDKLFISCIKLNKLDITGILDYFSALTMGKVKFNVPREAAKQDVNGDEEESGEDFIDMEDEPIDKEAEQVKYILTESELNFFEDTFSNLFEELKSTTKELTPRKVNIIYHRYLLCRNLLTARLYGDLSEKQIRSLMYYITSRSMGCKLPSTFTCPETKHMELADMLVPY
jgi:hypothetical protein